MSKQLGSCIELTVPLSRVDHLESELDAAVAIAGGMTSIPGSGFYKRQDNGKIDFEHVLVMRWDLDYTAPNFTAIYTALRVVVDKLLELGEESVLRRRYYTDRIGAASSRS